MRAVHPKFHARQSRNIKRNGLASVLSLSRSLQMSVESANDVFARLASHEQKSEVWNTTSRSIVREAACGAFLRRLWRNMFKILSGAFGAKCSKLHLTKLFLKQGLFLKGSVFPKLR